jgi:hypothetical protein
MTPFQKIKPTEAFKKHPAATALAGGLLGFSAANGNIWAALACIASWVAFQEAGGSVGMSFGKRFLIVAGIAFAIIGTWNGSPWPGILILIGLGVWFVRRARRDEVVTADRVE